MTSPSTYQSELQSIMLTYFDTEDLPCEDFTAIYEAYKGRKSLTASEVQASIASVIDEETDLPSELITAVVTFLNKHAASKESKDSKVTKVTKASKDSKAPTESKESKASETAPKETKTPKKAASKKSETALAAPGVTPTISSVVAPSTPSVPVAPSAAEVPAKAKRVRKAAVAVSPVEPVEPVVAVSPVGPSTGGAPVSDDLVGGEAVRPMNNVARFSQMVSHIRNPGAFATELVALQNQPVTMVDGFKRESGLYTMLETTGLLSHIGQTLTMKALVDDLYAKVPKPAIVTIAAIVRWYLPVAVREQLTADFVNLNLALPVKIRKAKKGRKRPAESSPAVVEEGSTEAVTKRAKRVKRVKKADAVPRELKGYALFTKRIGELMRGVSTPAYMATGVKISNNYTKPNAHYDGLVQTGVLALDGQYTLDGLCKLVQAAPFEGKMSVVRVSGLIWGMSNAETRERLTA